MFRKLFFLTFAVFSYNFARAIFFLVITYIPAYIFFQAPPLPLAPFLILSVMVDLALSNLQKTYDTFGKKLNYGMNDLKFCNYTAWLLLVVCAIALVL